MNAQETLEAIYLQGTACYDAGKDTSTCCEQLELLKSFYKNVKGALTDSGLIPGGTAGMQDLPNTECNPPE